jgi:hypothetical protein
MTRSSVNGVANASGFCLPNIVNDQPARVVGSNH